MLPLGVLPVGVSQGFPMRSLRFNSVDTANSTRTFSTPTAQNTFTWSLWAKRTALSTIQNLLGVGTTHLFGFNASDQLVVTLGASVTSTAVFRDVGAWYHIVWAQSGTSVTVYVNSTSVATGVATNSAFNTAVAHQIGSANSANYFNGYLADVVFVDGTALAPSSFAQANPLTGRWEPKPNPTVGLTMGTNGFWLSFHNNTSTTTLGFDDAGGMRGVHAGAKDWTLNNFSVTAGVNNDSFVDVPIDFGDGANGRGNYPTFNLLDPGTRTLSDGNLKWTVLGTNASRTLGNVQLPASGLWYWEITITAIGTGVSFGITSAQNFGNVFGGTDAGDYTYHSGGNKFNNNSGVAYGNTFTTNDVLGVAFDATNGKLFFSVNGTWQASGNPATGANPAFSSLTAAYWPLIGAATSSTTGNAYVNFGQRPFIATSSPALPVGFKALCTQNLLMPAIVKSSVAFDAKTYSGTGAAQPISGFGFSPDLVWIKSRNGAFGHKLTDAVRTATKSLDTTSTGAEATDTQGLTIFSPADGFTLGTDASYNSGTGTYVAWCWDEAVAAGFDIVTYTGDNTANRNISHGLGVAPKGAIVKRRDAASNWWMWHTSLAGATSFIDINGSAVPATANTPWGTGNWSSTQFMVTNNATENANANAATYVAYVFIEVGGFSKFGSYVGNGVVDGPFVWCGFRPRFVLIRDITNVQNWFMYDAKRDAYNGVSGLLYTNLTNTEAVSLSLDFTSNGFKLRNNTAGINMSAATHIFMAFAEAPFKYANAR